jgi:hypothetical protein
MTDNERVLAEALKKLRAAFERLLIGDPVSGEDSGLEETEQALRRVLGEDGYQTFQREHMLPIQRKRLGEAGCPLPH